MRTHKLSADMNLKNKKIKSLKYQRHNSWHINRIALYIIANWNYYVYSKLIFTLSYCRYLHSSFITAVRKIHKSNLGEIK